ncbi:MAG: LysR family transcriptional regulator [Clostridia bacterium]|nr:LysR family transcriptional regulator [Clostridia bacterium]
MLDYRVYTFLTLYDEMNYRRTAEKLNMTQPGVTQHIHYLEKYYGVKLFEYDGRTLSRTKNAEYLKRCIDSMKAEEKSVKDSFIKSDKISINIGATKTIGEFVIVPEIREFLSSTEHNLELVIDNTKNLLHKIEHSEIDFAIVEGVFDKSKYGYHLYKKEQFVGICSKNHPFANKIVMLEDTFGEDIVIREPLSGTRNLLQNAVYDRGFSFDNYRRCTSVNDFSVICDFVANNNAITFAYEPIAHCRDDITTFSVQDLQINGEFNFVYLNERIARQKIGLIFPEYEVDSTL